MQPSLAASAAPAPALRALPSDLHHQAYGRPGNCALHYIARRAGMEERQIRWLVGYVRQLILRHGFPPPIAPRLYKGEFLHGADAVDRGARWRRDAVDRWFDGLMPPHILEATQEAEADRAAREYADTLDARAALICAPRRKRTA